jgi:hypothetical protein
MEKKIQGCKIQVLRGLDGQLHAENVRAMTRVFLAV